jgi:hypothetical protein
MLARVANQRERLFAGNTPPDDQDRVLVRTRQMRAHTGQLHREVEIEMRMRVRERAADDPGFARVASDVQHSRGSRGRRRLIAGRRRSACRLIAIRGHTLPEVAERPLFQELLERHICAECVGLTTAVH